MKYTPSTAALTSNIFACCEWQPEMNSKRTINMLNGISCLISGYRLHASKWSCNPISNHVFYTALVIAVTSASASEYSYQDDNEGKNLNPLLSTAPLLNIWAICESIRVGPAKWHEHFPECGKSNRQQSPINIQTANVIERSFLPFKIGSNAVNEIKIENSGHSVQMSFVNPAEAPTISGGPLESTYKFAQLHFHWHSETRVDNKM